MDSDRFDAFSRKLAAGLSRRAAVGGIAAGLLGAFGPRTAAGAQVSQAHCGNKTCKNNPGKCNDGCVCCVFGNGNTRCTPPGGCSGTPTCPTGEVPDPIEGCVAVFVPPAVCTAGNDLQSGAPWVVCRADESTAWISHNAPGAGGVYHPTTICQGLGYAGYDLFGGNAGFVCGHAQGDTSCAAPGTETYSGGDGCLPVGGDELCISVQWRCVATL